MRRPLASSALIAVLGGLLLLPVLFAMRTPPRARPPAAALDSLADARQRYVQAVLKTIAGREGLPAREVFENVQLLGDLPAGRLLRVMDMGYGRSLGVSCEHCHNTAAWASDEKAAKGAARGMVTMVQRINGALLPAVPGLRGAPPTVNCTTCHRGQVIPALNLPVAPR